MRRRRGRDEDEEEEEGRRKGTEVGQGDRTESHVSHEEVFSCCFVTSITCYL